MANIALRLTQEQWQFVKYPENGLLVACPGSGKTRVILAKLLWCLNEIHDTSRAVACITYTNPAVYEIERRLSREGGLSDIQKCEVSTIHSFCLNNILRNFSWMLSEYPSGFSVLPPDSEKYNQIVNDILRDYGLPNQARDSFPMLNRLPNGTPIVSGVLNAEIAMDFWDRLKQSKFIDFPNIVYLSYQLLEENPFLARGIASRFAWILVDEFQDTSALQVEILTLISKYNRTRFALVGDPYQSIYGFAGARPELMYQFANTIKARDDFRLTGNFRSSSLIIDHAEQLCPRNPPMKAVGNSSTFFEEPLYVNAKTAFEAITDYFLPILDAHHINFGESAILSPNWFKLLHLGRHLREYGVPIVGPGARPYKRTHLFAQLAEQLCAYVEEPTPEKIRPIEREFFDLVLNVTGTPNFKVFTYEGRKTIIRLLRMSLSIRESSDSAVEWLFHGADEINQILIEEDYFSKTHGEILQTSVQEMIIDMKRNNVDLPNLSLDDLGMFANPSANMQLLTIHRAKGREFDAVAMIDLHEGQLPHRSATSGESLDAYKRLFYVGITRARKLLMYITDNENSRNIPSRFLKNDGLKLTG